MKRIFVLLLVVAVLLTGLIPAVAYGENGYDKKLEEMILKAKDLFNISDEYDKFDSSISSYDGKTYFYLNWSDSKGKLDNISISIDNNGNIISYSTYPSVYKEPEKKLPNISESEAEKIAMDFISMVAKDIAKSIKLVPSNTNMSIGDINYYFNYIRYENDIPFKENYVTVNVNKYTGEVTLYYVNWDWDIEFPKPKEIISLEKAKEIYKDTIGLKLTYKTKGYYPLYDSKEESYFLAYAPFYTDKGIDAFTGEKVQLSSYGIYYGAKETADGSLTQVELSSVEKLAGLLDEKTIEKIGRERLKLDDGFELYSKSLYKSYKNPDDYIWNLYFQKLIKDNYYTYVDVSLDAKTGELVSFYKTLQYNENEKPKINRQKALEIAEEYIKALQPDKFKEIELIEDDNKEDNQLTYSFQFIRKTNGIYVENDRIYVNVDAVGKEVYSYSISWYKGDFPTVDNIISLDNAYEILWDKIGFELNYVRTYDYSDPVRPKGVIKLVYSLNSDKPAIISASTGEILDYSGKLYKERTTFSYIDIDDSYAKEKIETLAKYGIGFKEEEFKPKEKITQADFIYLLWQTLNQYRLEDLSTEEIYKEFIMSGYIKEEEKNPEKPITKEEAVKYIIRVMRLDKVAELEDIYKDIFLDSNDISKGLKGYINLAYGLKIIIGDGSGYIRPKYELKREDAANIIFNYIFN